MPESSDPVGLFGKFNASFLMAITPEYRKIRSARTPGIPRRQHEKYRFAIEPKYTTVDDVKIRYADNGRLNAPTVLLLSPLPQSILCYDLIWKNLGEHFHLVALDLPGFGGSGGGVEYMNFPAQGDFLDKFIRIMDLHRTHILGPDVGMPAALHYVLNHEHDVASLILGDGPAISPSSNGSIINKMVNSAFWRLVFKLTDNQAFVEGAYRLAVVDYVPSNEEIADYLACYKGRIGTITRWFKDYPENLTTISPHLSSLGIPTQLFWGDLDQLLLVDNAERLHQLLPKNQLKVFRNCGHFSYQDRAKEFAQMVTDWVNYGYQHETSSST
ncbi:MAG: alpha/beta hydrolase [Gammaproteobacteria bacterium]